MCVRWGGVGGSNGERRGVKFGVFGCLLIQATFHLWWFPVFPVNNLKMNTKN